MAGVDVRALERATCERPALVVPPSGNASGLAKINGNWFLKGSSISSGLAEALMTDRTTAAGYGLAWPVGP